jgi:hypothetical protein
VFTIYTTRYNTREFYILSVELVSEPAVIIFLYVTYCMAFTIESDSAYCAVRTEILCMYFSLITPKSSLPASRIYCHLLYKSKAWPRQGTHLLECAKSAFSLRLGQQCVQHAGMAERTKGSRLNISRTSPPFALWLVIVFKQFMKSVTMTKRGKNTQERDKVIKSLIMSSLIADIDRWHVYIYG